MQPTPVAENDDLMEHAMRTWGKHRLTNQTQSPHDAGRRSPRRPAPAERRDQLQRRRAPQGGCCKCHRQNCCRDLHRLAWNAVPNSPMRFPDARPKTRAADTMPCAPCTKASSGAR